ncbi:NADH-quinone oxidoreductase subunit M [Microlunatus speluncae]|uniref:NADH-quinone oxidoreductase subunit M n=1 Tax=Microlunatus speluncae TaxID=2594267 RepID=UPI00126664DC|nr:NADH-quinone oxidoreductase subunit M [Microlunatus speluncae]
MEFPWLTTLAVLPLLGAAALIFIKGTAAKQVAVAVSVLTLIIGIVVAVRFNPAGGMQFIEQVPWIEALGVNYALGLDGIGLTLVLLVAVVTPVVIIAAWNDADPVDSSTSEPIAGTTRVAPKYDARVFFALVLVVEGVALLLFTATDVFLFYIFFEIILIPMYFLIGGFGGARRAQAATKFLIYGLLGGFVMLAAVIGLWVVSSQQGDPSYLLSDLRNLPIDENTQRLLFCGFMFAFAIKAPLVPFHTWLPDAAEESTPGGATMMVGVMDKLGTFGMIRFCLELFPDASRWATPVILVLAVISIIYGAIMAVASKNLMRFISYTSISHFGFIVLGIFAFTTQSMVGSTLYMLNHGLSTAALFLVAGYLIKRRGSALIADFGGVQKVAPVMGGLFLFGALATVSLPGLSSFVSEFMVLAGTFGRHPVFAIIATSGIVLAAVYMLLTYQRTMTGPISADVEATMSDVGLRERLALAPVVLLILAIGFFPKPLLDVIEPAVTATMSQTGVTDPQPMISAEGER